MAAEFRRKWQRTSKRYVCAGFFIRDISLGRYTERIFYEVDSIGLRIDHPADLIVPLNKEMEEMIRASHAAERLWDMADGG